MADLRATLLKTIFTKSVFQQLLTCKILALSVESPQYLRSNADLCPQLLRERLSTHLFPEGMQRPLVHLRCCHPQLPLVSMGGLSLSFFCEIILLLFPGFATLCVSLEFNYLAYNSLLLGSYRNGITSTGT